MYAMGGYAFETQYESLNNINKFKKIIRNLV